MSDEERLAAELGAFLKGQRSFARLLTGLAFIVDGDPDGGAATALEGLLERAVSMRRLPPDLAAAIREGVFGDGRPAAGAAASLALASDGDLLATVEADAGGDGRPTTPLPRRARPAAATAPAAATPAFPDEAVEEDDQPTVRLTGGAADPAADALAARVDDVVLSAMMDDYRGYRTRAAPAAPREAEAGATDALLSQFAGARARREAVRAAAGTGRTARPGSGEPQAHARTLDVGAVLKDRFVLDARIGEGGMGVVFKAVDLRRLEASHRAPYVAIKVLSREFARDYRAFRTLEAEARKAQLLSHPNIVHIHDFDRDAGHAFVVMELLAGKDLATVLASRGSLPFPLAARVFEGVFDALEHAHARNVVHCDVKPGNVFLLDNGQVKVLDFGISTAAGLTGFDVAELGSYTGSFASPDVLEGRPQTPQDDIYALGCTLYQALAGQHPFRNRTALEALELGLAPARIRTIPAEAWKAVETALAFDRDRRFQTIAAFRSRFYRRPLISRVLGGGRGAGDALR